MIHLEMKLHDKQKKIARSKARFKVIRAGRKGGKSAFEIESLCYKAIVKASKLNLSKENFATGRKVLYIAPTQDQARNIVWEALKTRLEGVGVKNEQQLSMVVPNEDGGKTTIKVGGWENRENYRGLTDVTHITFDEVDTLRDFFTSWREIFRPLFLDTQGTADFIGTPKKESGNLRRLEKEAEFPLWECFHFTSRDNPYIPVSELDSMEEEYKDDRNSYRQEILAEYVDNVGSLIRFNSLIDVFTNTVDKSEERYLIIDIADDGTDKTIISYWEGLSEKFQEEHERLNTEGVTGRIRELAILYKIPFSHILVDAIGVGAGVASNSLLDGIVGFKSSFAPIKTDINIVLPNMGTLQDAKLTSDFRNLRSQCIFVLADYINNHKISSECSDRIKEKLIEELSLYQNVSTGDGKRMATQKEDIKKSIGRSPDNSDIWIMRMYFEVLKKVSNKVNSQNIDNIREAQRDLFRRRESDISLNSSK